ncbi:Condensin2nSMC domain-containing protein [Cephalotus follicularis]|uniref:Condensin2nSMC domain-containing protein n=1 Tax=Cephalotus follicularis TaxID=3775 RepID=A0A1Q3CL21_CEPFO|nr:Condensin2nSMC domain-containing protein [Cephalotus follicularis]
MEKRLRSSLQSSPQEFLNSATRLTLKTSKQTLKSLIHSIPPSSPLSSSLPPSLHHLIRHHLNPTPSPPLKRPRRSSSPAPEPTNRLRVLTHIALLCASHPTQAFSASDLLPAVQSLHDNLILFESDPVLSSDIAGLCEFWWKESLPGREMLISQSLPFFLSRSLTLKKKVDVHRLHTLRDAFALLDFEDDSIEDLKLLLIRCVIAPLYLKTEDGRKFVAFICGLSGQVLKEVVAMIRSQILYGRKSMLEAYGDIVFRAWKGDSKKEIEDGFLQGLIEGAIYASSGSFAASIRRVLGGFVDQRATDGVDKLLFRLAEPVIFRSLQVANSNVRQNALHLLLDLFPLEDPDSTKEVKDALLGKQFFLLERLLMDDCPNVRVVAVEGWCRILHLFWEITPSSTITKILTKIFDDMSHDICNEVRLATLNGVIYLLGNPLSHEILKVLLPRLGHLMLDNVLSVRVAVADLLLLLDIQTSQFNKVVGLDTLLSTLANDQPQVAQKVTRLLMPSYFPSRVTIEEACNRCLTLIKRSPMAGARFCEYAVSEGASLKSLMELLKVLISSVLSNDKQVADQIEGILIAAAYLCNNLVSEPSYEDALKELFTGDILKCLFTAGSTGRAHASILDIVSAISPADVNGLLKESMNLLLNCSGLSENLESQAEVKSAHKLFLCCHCFDDMFEALTRFLQKTAYRCYVKFGTAVPKQIVSSAKRKKSSSSVKIPAKWKHVSGKQSSSFEEDYSIAVGIAWQIKDLLIAEETRNAILGSPILEVVFLALKVISEVSIEQCMQIEYMDTSSDAALDQILDHLLDCSEKLFAAGDPGKSGKPSDLMQDDNKMAHPHRQKHRKLQADASSSTVDGSDYSKQKGILNKVKMLTAVLKFIVDANTIGLASHKYGRCLKFASAYVQNIISTLGQQSIDQMQFKEEELKVLIPCLKSSFTYAAKLLNVVLQDTSQVSQTAPDMFYLANDLLDLITSIELYLGSGYAARMVAATKPWLPDLVLALGVGCMFKQTQAEKLYFNASDCIKHHYPSWLSILAKTELCELSEVSSGEEGDRVSEPEEFPAFKKLVELIVSLLKRNSNLLDAVGMIFLTGSVVGLERKDFRLVLRLLQFVCVKLIGLEDREWNGFDMMLSSLPDIYPLLEREIEEQSNEDERHILHGSRALLEPVWLYHVYETGRFSVMEE